MADPVVVVGGGAMGAATAWWLARTGRPVTLLEQFAPGHDRGSSHGSSRIFRFSYADRRYVDLAVRAHALWRDLQEEAGEALLTPVGCLEHGPTAAVDALHRTMSEAGVTHRMTDPAEAAERWPLFRFDEAVLYQPEAGRVDADATVRALHARAARHGAEVRAGVRVREVRPRGDGAEVVTDGATLRAGVVVLAAGAWLPGLLAGAAARLPELAGLPPLRVTQEQPAYFAPLPGGPAVEDVPSIVHSRRFPGGAVDRPLGLGYYALGGPGRGVKLGEHGTGPAIDPDRRVPPDPAGVRRLHRYARDWLPGVDSAPVAVDTCLYTSTPDEDFVIRRIGPLVVCSPCSGHGFKFVPAIGELTAAVALGGRDGFPVPG